MCNQYTTKASAAEIAALFGATVSAQSNAGPGTIFPGAPGMVVRQVGGERTVNTMTWGFPMRLKGMKPGSKPRPVNNARADKLDSFMWRYSFEERRCLIPVSEFAEAEGEKGAKTKTWFSLPDEPLFAVAGLWRNTDEWGLAYSMVMTEACRHVADVHGRMPVILKRSDWSDWLDGAPDNAGLLCRPYPDLMVVNRTKEPWVKRTSSEPSPL
jgi:putative SOS response-associated peptidase YedK